MEIPDSSVLDLAAKVRAWIPWWRGDLSGISRDIWMPDTCCGMCYECNSRFTASNRKHCCRSCGRLFCENCMHTIINTTRLVEFRISAKEEQRIKVCKFCFQSIGQEVVMAEDGENLTPSLSFRRKKFSNSNVDYRLNSSGIGADQLLDSEQLAHFLDQQMRSSFFAVNSLVASSSGHLSPISLHGSAIRSDEEDADDAGKNYLSPPSEYHPDISDIDASSTCTRHELYSLKSVTSSPMDSPSMMTDSPDRVDYHLQYHRGGSPMSLNDVFMEEEPMDTLRRHETETQNLDIADDSPDDVSIFQCQSQNGGQPLDFENNGLIWFPPPPEDEEDELENSLFDYNDEDDDVGESGLMFSSSSFGNKAFHGKNGPSEEHKEPLRAVVHGHFRALVSQLLKGGGIDVGSENEKDCWLEIVTSLAWQAANFVKPDTSRGGSMDPSDYVKVKCVACGNPGNSTLIKGVVCTKNIKHKRMTSQYRKPRLLLLGGALEYQRVPNKLASLETLLQLEMDHLKRIAANIEAYRPNVLLVEKSVSSYAQDYLLAKEISLVLNVKRPLLERIARCTGAHIVPSIDNFASPRLGHCEIFRLERVTEESAFADQHNKKTVKTLMFFEGCPRRLGCTVVLRGRCRDELKKVKHVVQYAVFAAYHLSLETSFLADEGATLPKLSLKSPITLPGKPMNADSAISLISDPAIPIAYGPTVGESQTLDPACLVSPSELLEKNEGSLGFNSEIEWESSYEHLSPVPIYDLDHRFLDCEIRDSILDGAPGSCLGSQSESLRGHMNALVKFRTCSHFPIIKQEGRENVIRDDEGELGNQRPGSAHGKRIKNILAERNLIPKDYFSSSDNHQSILVSLSSRCVLKDMVCERSQLFRIKFYGSFDKPLGRYLRDNLFDQASCCRYCKEPAEAHVLCYTHPHGSLTINVKRLPSLKLPGEREGRIWMWHRCLKCAHKDGVPPATRRVVMSDAAWGLSLGKFLELSFSNHATANRVASCGHSLQRDCLRYYGFGCMVAFFRYSPIDILSVQLPPAMLEFNGQIQREWARKEAADVSNKMEFLHAEVFDALHSIEKKITAAGTGCESSKANDFYTHIAELKELLKKERCEYDGLLQPPAIEKFQHDQMGVDVLDLNHLRRCLLLDSYVWDRRLCLFDYFFKTKGPFTMIDPRTTMDDTISTEVKDWMESEIFSKDPLMAKKQRELDLESFNPELSEVAKIDSTVKSTSFVDSENLESTSDLHQFQEEKTSLQRLSSFESNLSEKIDSAWIGKGQTSKAPAFQVVPLDGEEAGSVARRNLTMNHVSHRKIMTPVRVYSFDSALRFRDRTLKGFSLAASNLSSVKSFHTSEDFGSFVRDPIPNMLSSYSRTSPRSIQRLDFIFNHTPLFFPSLTRRMSEGARLLLPPTGRCNVVVAVYDDEPTSVIAYALSSKDYEDCLCDKPYESESFKEISTGPVWQSNSSLDSDDLQCRSFGSEEASSSRGSLVYSDPKKPSHVRISFSDESFSSGKVKFSVTCYFAKQFDGLRRKCCPSELDFIRSLSRCRRWSAQGGKSNVYFARSFDERFIIKRITKTELDSFEEFAPEYFKYLSDSISSGSPTCLAKVLGIYQVTVKHLKGGREIKMDLMVMENLFFGRKISNVYDLKGSTRSRYNPDTSGSNKVLLDMNLLEALRTKPIFLGSKAKRSLERAVWNDTSFLASVDVMDYSLLVGVDEEHNELVLGIIDFMRQYTWDKHLETWVKASGILGGPKNVSPTVISPKEYKKRFRKAMSTYFLTVPDQWSS